MRLIGRVWGAAQVAALAGAAGAGVPDLGAAPDATDRAVLVIEVAADGRVTAVGRLPAGLARRDLEELVPGLDRAEIAGEGRGDADLWRRALGALPVALPRIERARIEICDGRISVAGRLRPGFARRETGPALRAAAGPGWDVQIALAEAPPEAEAVFGTGAGGRWLTGFLPAGLAVRQARALVAPAAGGRLTTGAQGDSAAWMRALGVVDRLLALHEDAHGRIAAARIEIDGRLAPGQRRAEIAAWAATVLPDGWTLALDSAERAAEPFAARLDPATGATERLINGFWIPMLSIAPEPGPCDRATAAAQRQRRIGFVTGESEIDAAARRVLDRIAGIALACLRGPLRLVIGGHTDSTGAPERNRELSEARARAVRDALVARGIPPAAMAAVGHGDSRPLFANDTEAGRRRNRRISFDWVPGRGPGQRETPATGR